MTKPTIRKIYWSLLGIMLAATLFFSSGFKIPMMDKKADSYFTKAIQKAGAVYVTCRVINASISVIQNSNIALEPAGVGVSLAVGQVLDPIDDMTERLADVLVTAIVSLGIQKLGYEMSVSFTPPILAILLFILSLLIWFKNRKIKSFQKAIVKITMIVIIVRLCLPVSSFANDFLYQHFFKEQIYEAKQMLSVHSDSLDSIGTFNLPEIDGVLGTIKNSASLLIDKSREFQHALVKVVNNMTDIIANLVKLTTLYVGVFLIQVILLPLLIFFIFIKTTNSLFKTDAPIILQHSSPEQN